MNDTESTAVTESATEAPAQRRVAPGWVVWALVVLATIVAMAATANTWVDRQLLDTDQWVEVSDEMLADDDVRGALSTFLVAELFETVDVQGELESLLPGRTAGLAGPITSSLRANAVEVVDQLLGSEQFGRIWTEVNTVAHTAFVRVVTDDTRDSVSIADGRLVLDAGPLLAGLADRLGLPSGVGERIPEDAGQIVVFESDELDAVQQGVQVIEVLSLYLFVLVVVLYAVAVYLAADRRRTVRNIGWSLVIGSAVLLLVRRIGVDVAVEQLAEAQGGRAAVDAIVSIATGLFNELAWAGVSLGALIVLYAIVTGPTRAASTVRRLISPVMAKPVGAWLLAVGFLVLYLVVMPGFSVQRWIPALTFVALFVAAVESLRRQVVREHPAAPEPAGA